MPTVRYETLRSYKLAGDLKTKYLDVEATRVDVSIEIDSALDALIKAGKESLKISHLGDVAKAEIDKSAKLFSSTIQDIEKKIAKDKLDIEATGKKVKEANEVLKHYAKIVEANANAAVEKEWQAYISRRKHLRDFRVRCVAKLVLGSISVGAAVTSAVLSFGTLWINIAAAVKGTTDLIQTVKTWAQDIDAVYASLVKDIDKVNQLNRERERAFKQKNGQKLSKTKEGLKELANALLPITKSMLKSTSEIEHTCKQFLGLVAKIENQADEIVGNLNKLTSLMAKLPDKDLADDLKRLVKEMEKSFKKLFEEITILHRKSQKAGNFGERALKAATQLRKKDTWLSLDPEKSLDMGKHGVTAYAAANFIWNCCTAGKSLIGI